MQITSNNIIKANVKKKNLKKLKGKSETKYQRLCGPLKLKARLPVLELSSVVFISRWGLHTCHGNKEIYNDLNSNQAQTSIHA